MINVLNAVILFCGVIIFSIEIMFDIDAYVISFSIYGFLFNLINQ
jgi:hypothetical protein